MTFKQTLKKIKNLEIQSARNVAKEGLKALAKEMESSQANSTSSFLKQLEKKSSQLASVRVTEPALRNGLRRIHHSARNSSNVKQAKQNIQQSVRDYVKEMENARQSIQEIGQKRIRNDDVILTHCHSTTVMGIFKKAWENGKKFEVICTETRPKLQGRKTARELVGMGVPTTMIVDSAVGTVVNDCDLFIAGADAVTSDGFIINKIGTSVIALAAKQAGTKTSCTCSTFKFDPDTLTGEWEPIEQRDSKEIWEKPPKGLKIKNPAFDFTHPSLIDFLICEEGVINPQQASDIMRDKWGGLK
jgi:ribose 1,5-bisphosphate isomerase